MSIIYDALQKVGSSIDLAPEAKAKKRGPRLALYLLLAVVIGVALFFGWRFFSPAVKSAIAPVKEEAILPPAATPPAEEAVSVKEEPAAVLEPSSSPLPAEPEEEIEPLPSFISSGVFFSEGEAFALVNNRIVKEGDTIEGAKVLKITLEGIMLDYNGSPIEISSANKP